MCEFCIRTASMHRNPAADLSDINNAGTGTGNNYAYLISDEPTKDAMVVDPANPPECAVDTFSWLALNSMC